MNMFFFFFFLVSLLKKWCNLNISAKVSHIMLFHLMFKNKTVTIYFEHKMECKSSNIVKEHYRMWYTMLPLMRYTYVIPVRSTTVSWLFSEGSVGLLQLIARLYWPEPERGSRPHSAVQQELEVPTIEKNRMTPFQNVAPYIPVQVHRRFAGT
jgi:hypothetical protein